MEIFSGFMSKDYKNDSGLQFYLFLIVFNNQDLTLTELIVLTR
jgi:hypothetical protein